MERGGTAVSRRPRVWNCGTALQPQVQLPTRGRRVPETKCECPNAHRACDGDRPARYLKRGAPSWIVAYTKLVAVSASLNVPAWAARGSRMKSPTHFAGWAGGFAISPTRTKKLVGWPTHRPPRIRNDAPLTWTRRSVFARSDVRARGPRLIESCPTHAPNAGDETTKPCGLRRPQSPETRMVDVDSRSALSSVLTVGTACHAEGRGFESLHPLHRTRWKRRGFFWKGPETERARARLASGQFRYPSRHGASAPWVARRSRPRWLRGSQGDSDVICSLLRAMGSSAESTRRQRRLTSSLTAPKAGSHCREVRKMV
jgi:hypothetical protein